MELTELSITRLEDLQRIATLSAFAYHDMFASMRCDEFDAYLDTTSDAEFEAIAIEAAEYESVALAANQLLRYIDSTTRELVF